MERAGVMKIEVDMNTSRRHPAAPQTVRPLPRLLKSRSIMSVLVGITMVSFPLVAEAQEENPPKEEKEQEQSAEEPETKNEDADANDTEPREITAAELNARQRIGQTLTVTRFINGKAVETKKVAVPDGQGMPVRETEAGGRIADIVRAQVDREVLTRREAFEEARLEFNLVDANSDQFLTREEFVSLVEVRQDDPNYASFFTPFNKCDKRGRLCSSGAAPGDL